MRFVIVLALSVALGSVSCGEIRFKKGSPHAKLEGGGILKGKLEFSRDGRPYNSFFGIKFGEIPERFSEAKLNDGKWEGVKDAVGQVPACTQGPLILFAEDGGNTVGEEDCLFLNVHVPMSTKPREGKGLPVMVWIHGGGFMWGDGYSYGPQYFMDEPVIIVTIQYRLGVFGFLSTGDEVVPGNNGLKDAVLALKWIQKNIKNFGGDAGKVTIFGESAGAGVTSYLLLSPLAKGLFHRAISQSGTVLCNWAYNPDPKKTAVELAEYLKCPTSSSQEILKCLREMPVKELNEAQSGFWSGRSWPRGGPSIPFYPTADEKSPNPFLTQAPYTILGGSGKISDVPWMVGMTEDECAGVTAPIIGNETLLKELDSNWDELCPTVYNYRDYVNPSEYLEVARKIREFVFGSKTITKELSDGLVTSYSDNAFNHGTAKAAMETVKRKGGPVYLYQFAHRPPITLYELLVPMPDELKKKVGHGDDLTFLFSLDHMAGNFGLAEKLPLIKPDSEHEEFSRNLVKLWATFARKGEPDHTWGTSAERKWLPLSKNEVKDSNSLKWYRIDANPRHVDDPYRERFNFWDELYAKHYLPILTKTPSHHLSKTEL